MSEVDLAILAVIAISSLISFLRGFFREAMSLGTWLAAILCTLFFTSRFAVLLPMDTVESPQARATISAVILFVGTLLAGNLMSWVVGRVVGKRQQGLADRMIGAIFGAARGVVIVSLLVLSANLVPDLKRETWWRDSKTVPEFQKVARKIHVQLPNDIGQHFDFTPPDY